MPPEAAGQFTFANLLPGDPAPLAAPRARGLDHFAYDTLAGRYILMCFFGSAHDDIGRAAVTAAQAHRADFDDDRVSFFGVSIDPDDERHNRARDAIPGMGIIWDFDSAFSRLFGAAPKEQNGSSAAPYRRIWIVLDPSLHVLKVLTFEQAGQDHEQIFAFLRSLPPPGIHAGFEIPAPILVLPRVLEPELCRRLISIYDQHGGMATGVMRDSKPVLDGSFKRRKDVTVEDDALRQVLRARLFRRVAPEIHKLFFMKISHVERYIVGCYAAEDGGIFRAHRDNTVAITAHRRYAVSINLNDDFDGGEVGFPEYNRKGYKAPPGWAIIFPCAIMHKVTRVTAGRRYAFLPFVFDESGERIRQSYLSRAAAPVLVPAASGS